MSRAKLGRPTAKWPYLLGNFYLRLSTTIYVIYFEKAGIGLFTTKF